MKAVEQTVLHNGSWRVSWALTGLPEPRPGGALHQGLSSPAEIAASVQYMKDARAIEELVRKETMPTSTTPGSATTPHSVPSGPIQPAGGGRRARRGGGGGGKGGSAPESSAK
eukprot:3981818-Amphidinium_carterae.2